VPVPGGALETIEHLEVTRPEAVAATLEAHRRAFAAAGAEAAFEAVIALVAQPGVEFDDRNVVVYEPERARKLSAALSEMPGLVFEAHSTDYQPGESLARLVRDGFAILKVGPGLTFALREVLYGLDQIAAALYPSWCEHSLMAEMEKEMLANPGYWQSHYRGDPEEQRVLRHFSYSGPAALGPPDRNQCPGAPDQSIPPDALSTRGRRHPGSDAQDPGARSRSRCTSCLRGGVRCNDVGRTANRLGKRPAMTTPTGGPVPPANDQARTTQRPQEMP
jgi:D-tagatose-1,6-bisphosphate aldolase subunit GatZ/KbaZ